MFKLNLLLLAFIISSNILANEKHLYILGGGGDPAGVDTIFDNDLKNMGKFAVKSNWKTTVSFDGGHEKTEKIIKENFGNSTNMGDFVEKNYQAIINEITNKLKNGELKSGDQLMLILNTHGAQNQGEVSHQVALARNAAKDLTNLSGARTISLDTLAPIIKLAKENGVKLAFIDQSCHSGSSINLATEDTCIITATGANHYGYSGTIGFLGFSFAMTFDGKFNKAMEPGKNLEELYLKVRATKGSADFPMISTPEGIEIQNLIYELMTPYLYFNNSYSSKFDNMYSTKNIDEFACKSENNFKKLMDLINQVELMKDISISSKDFEKLRAALNKYRNYQVEYENSYKNLKLASSEIVDVLNKEFPKEANLFNGVDGITIINSNYDSSIKFTQELVDNAKNKFAKDMWTKSLDELKTKKEIASQLSSKLQTSTLDKIANQKKMYEKSGVTYDFANDVASGAKDLYSALYAKNKKDKTNPCRDFVL